MDDPALVGVADRLADRPEEPQPQLELLPRHGLRARAEPLAERRPAHELHGEEVVPVVGVARLVDRGDVGVLEAAEDLRLAVEHAGVEIVDVVPLAHDLERDAAARVLLLGFPDDAHPALAEQPEDAIPADRGRHLPGGCAADWLPGAPAPEIVGAGSGGSPPAGLPLSARPEGVGCPSPDDPDCGSSSWRFVMASPRWPPRPIRFVGANVADNRRGRGPHSGSGWPETGAHRSLRRSEQAAGAVCVRQRSVALHRVVVP